MIISAIKLAMQFLNAWAMGQNTQFLERRLKEAKTSY